MVKLVSEVDYLKRLLAELVVHTQQIERERDQIALHNEELLSATLEARDALLVFRDWGNALNNVLGYKPHIGAWDQTNRAVDRLTIVIEGFDEEVVKSLLRDKTKV